MPCEVLNHGKFRGNKLKSAIALELLGIFSLFVAGVYLSEAQNPIPPRPLTHSIRV